MNRLRDSCDGEGKGDDPVFLRGVELLRKTQPTRPPAESVKRRVWWAMGRAPAPGLGVFRARLLRLAVTATVALVAGTAGAVIARRWIVPRPDAGALLAPPAPAPRAERARPARAADVAEAPAALAGPPREGPALKPPSRGVQRKPAVPASTAAAVARERSEVLDALIALRRAHDPVRAGTLLDQVSGGSPAGRAAGRGPRPGHRGRRRSWRSGRPGAGGTRLSGRISRGALRLVRARPNRRGPLKVFPGYSHSLT